MLIIPLHRAPTLANFPWVTVALIFINVFVFAGLQSGDGRVIRQAFDYYTQAKLADREFPAYRDWLADRAKYAEHADRNGDMRREVFKQLTGSDDKSRNEDVNRQAQDLALRILQSDAAFLADLEAGDIITPQMAGYADWREHRTEFDRIMDSTFTDRWMLRYSEFDLRRLFGAMFLHAGVGHLLGNMLFLAFLGLLVEGALGHALFLAVYLLGGLGGGMFSLWWHWGETSGALGASGAISALMGAYCVLWGLRKVRFFWWFFVVFDYVKAPALVLLPFWLGWQVLNMFFNKSDNTAFDIHASSIVAGALLAWGVLALHWEHRDFLDEDVIADARADQLAALAKARGHIGRLEITAARALLEPLAQAHPDDFDVRVALYRCARCEPRRARLAETARAALGVSAQTPAEAREQKGIYDDFLRTANAPPLDAPRSISLARHWVKIGAGIDAMRLLTGMVDRIPATPGLPIACLLVAHELRQRNEKQAAKTLLEKIVGTYPQGNEAGKARLLLTDGA